MKARLDEITKPTFPETERHARDENVLRGLMLTALFFYSISSPS
jgi:hypothetical protein